MQSWMEKFGLLLSRLATPRFLRQRKWPPIPGKYFILNPQASVAISTLGSPELARTLYHNRPANLCIIGKTETENVGIEKVVLNILANPAIGYLILAGEDPPVHLSGRSLLALSEHGLDRRGRIRRAPGRQPVLHNLSPPQVEAFRNRIHIIDLIGCLSAADIMRRMEDLPRPVSADAGTPGLRHSVPRIRARKPRPPHMDPAGYFVITPDRERQLITVEHYGYDHRLLRIIEGSDARSLYREIISRGWVSRLSHAAYLGRELTRARNALDQDQEYYQDQA